LAVDFRGDFIMRRLAAVLTLFVAALGPASFAHAGVYSDDLAKCVVRSSSDSDQQAFVVWIFIAMSQHPAIKSYSNVTDAQRDAANRQTGKLMERLLTVDCRKETVAALKYEGASGLEAAFNVLGQVAARGLFSDPKVAEGMAGLASSVDDAKIAELFKEAGIADKK
jgi:hypothetical protein